MVKYNLVWGKSYNYNNINSKNMTPVTYITYDSLDIIIFIKIKKFNQPLCLKKFPGR